MKLELSQQSVERHSMSNFVKILLVGAELLHEDITKLIVAFRNFCERA